MAHSILNNHNHNMYSGRAPLSHSDSSEDSDEDSVLDEHGERVERSSVPREQSSNHNDNTLLDGEAYYDDNNNNNDKKKTRRPKAPQLTVEHLLGPDGLIRLATDCRTTAQSRRPAPTVRACAAYTQALLQRYTQWAHDLLPHQHSTDTLYQIAQSVGRKKPIQQGSLNEQRHALCRQAHLERVLGRDTAERILQEYDQHCCYQQQQQNQQEEEELLPPSEHEATVTIAPAAAAAASAVVDNNNDTPPVNHSNAATTHITEPRPRRRVIDDDDFWAGDLPCRSESL